MGILGALGQDVLNVLCLTGGKRPEPEVIERLGRVLGRPPGPGYRIAVYRLRRKRLLVRRGRGPTSELRLTRAGRATAELPSTVTMAHPAPDGLAYFVTYDIPTRLNTVRDQFRMALRRAGWGRLHRSVWISRRDIRDMAIEAAERLGVEPFVFIGTGTLLKAGSRTKPEDFAAEVRREVRTIVSSARRDVAAAYRMWSGLTARLRQPCGAAQLEADLRRGWGKATRALQAALR